MVSLVLSPLLDARTLSSCLPGICNECAAVMNQLTILLLLRSLLLLVSAKGSHLIFKLESTLTSMLLFVHIHMITKSPHFYFRSLLQTSPFLLHDRNHCLRSKSLPISSFYFIFLSIYVIHFQHEKNQQRISKIP